ncbi:hypothetical protein U8607_20540 [Methylobacterium durans]|uniref:hypothetical protein n=1 Tax=Methylobacterium durans TaxID=2202825 RepID=UPI002AFE9C77|nr:hypothetical protein [Methylobacterium durans]MEA1834485.1 hypothetical protein [Methylobacterium durans]
MSIFVHLTGVSAALAAGLALAMPGAGGPAKAAQETVQDVDREAPRAALAAPAAEPARAPLCREAAWPYAVAACSAGTAGSNGRLVRVISFAGTPPQVRGGQHP